MTVQLRRITAFGTVGRVLVVAIGLEILYPLATLVLLYAAVAGVLGAVGALAVRALVVRARGW